MSILSDRLKKISKKAPSTSFMESGATSALSSLLKQKLLNFGTLLFNSVKGDLTCLDKDNKVEVTFVSMKVFTDRGGNEHHNVLVVGKGFEFTAGFLPKYSPSLGEHSITARVNSRDNSKVDIVIQ